MTIPSISSASRAHSSVYPHVLEELRRGRKQSHWMWFIFPQLAGLGHSAMAQRFAVSSCDEALASDARQSPKLLGSDRAVATGYRVDCTRLGSSRPMVNPDAPMLNAGQ
jgi:uncharacterized protein (DUF1810 family)